MQLEIGMKIEMAFGRAAVAMSLAYWSTVETVLLHDARAETFDAVREVMRYWRKCEKQRIFSRICDTQFTPPKYRTPLQPTSQDAIAASA